MTLISAIGNPVSRSLEDQYSESPEPRPLAGFQRVKAAGNAVLETSVNKVLFGGVFREFERYFPAPERKPPPAPNRGDPTNRLTGQHIAAVPGAEAAGGRYSGFSYPKLII